MSTISENLQIIADSTAAIKQAIIDKGGDITGDITTWADAIRGLSGEGNENTEVEINNVYVSIISNYATTLGGITVNVFCSLEKALDVSMRAYVFSNDGDQAQKQYITVNAGATEFEFTSVAANEENLSTNVAVVLSNFYGERVNTKYTFKYNYL